MSKVPGYSSETVNEDQERWQPVLVPLYTTLLTLLMPKLILPHFTSLSKV